MGGVPLADFAHPERAVYLLGAEDTGLPQAVTQAAAFHVALPSVRDSSFNVAAAGSILMYDRHVKRVQVREWGVMLWVAQRVWSCN